MTSTAFLSPLPVKSGIQTSAFLPSCSLRPKPLVCPRVLLLRMGLLDGLKNVLQKPSPDKSDTLSRTQSGLSRLSTYDRAVSDINDLEPRIEALSDEALCARIVEIRTAVLGGTLLEDVLVEVFAIVREASYRVLGLRHYDVQLVGAMVLNDGCVAEMLTGEGKTIVAALPACLNALEGQGVLIVTVNDYLARRDAETVGQVLKFLGLSVGLIQGDSDRVERREAYLCDVTYVTNSELGFDFLRDNLAMSIDDVVLTRPLGFCIVDEADSILIDEARTPLIISGRVDAATTKYATAKRAADVLVKDVHYTVNEKEQSVLLTEKGFIDLEQALKVDDLFDATNPWAAFITNALKAKEVFKVDVNYIVGKEEQLGDMNVQIIDEFTGRVLKGRRWSDGVHQAVEAKEGISISKETSTLAKISYQAFFKLFNKLAGMTGTAATEAKEFEDVYGLSVVSVPTALPLGRKDYPDVIFRNAEGKYRAIMREIARVAPTGRPILVGTTSVEASEALSHLLTEVEVEHDVLNAKPESALRESEIVAQAGRKYSITIATNMAGRGTDIRLGGNADYFGRALARRELATQNEELYRELNDLNQPILIDDEVLPVELSEEAMNQLKAAVTVISKHSRDRLSSLQFIDEIVGIAAEFGPVPEGMEGVSELREALEVIGEELSETVAMEKEEVLALGGLYIIGTERAESRRVDNQLRGRAGRQGDPGGSRFFLGLDDRLFRVFGGDKVTGILETFRVDEDTPIENAVVNKTLDSAQENVEAYFREIREQLFKYDEILSKQRSVFYVERRRVVVGDGTVLEGRLRKDCVETVEDVVRSYTQQSSGGPVDFNQLSAKLVEFFGGLTEVSPEELKGSAVLEDYVIDRIDILLDEKKRELEQSKEGFNREIVRYLWLTQMDNMWLEHMKRLDFLKEFVVLRSYEGDDPFQVYQTEGFDLFTGLLTSIRRNSVYSYFQYRTSASTGTNQN